NINMEHHKETPLSDYKKIALIDCAVPGENNLLPQDCTVSIIIDHHPLGERDVKAEYMDIQPNVGATSTTMTKYLQELNLPISAELATALLYGIRTDTLEFKRNTNSADLTAAAFLYPLANHEMLNQISSPSRSTETLEILGDAIKNRRIKGSYLLTNVGMIRNKDALPQAADYLLNLEGIDTVICYGVSENNIYISGRNKDIRVNLGETLRTAFGEDGSAGGHAESAGAQIPLGVFSGASKEALMKLAEESVTKRFLEVVGFEVEDQGDSDEKREKKD
ncbi:MAG: bifunctional oligoribonuclease/PAP phosphatase NrnA, partial [Methanosarcinales archaeon]|nr:bifunctional oligoribonuclease/PAP phosphatase NrnA [Methanosarcinales archaeon]